jgi:hypothetical protein
VKLSAVSRAAVSDASARGTTMLKPLERHSGTGFSVAVITASANLGPLILPSRVEIVHGGIIRISWRPVAVGRYPGPDPRCADADSRSVIAHPPGLPMAGELFNVRRIAQEPKRC